MSQVTALLIATSSGRLLADELSAQGAYVSLIEGPDGVPKALLGVNGQPVLNYWLNSIKHCPRLAPLNDRVYVLCNESNLYDVQTWAADPQLSAGGFPPANVLSNGAEDSLGMAADIATFLSMAQVPAGACLVVVEADALCGPGINLSRMVEHAVVVGRDTVAYMAAPAGMPLEGEAVIVLEDPAAAASSASQRVTGVDPTPSGMADGETLTAVLAPVAVLRPGTVERVVAAASAGPSSPSLAGLVASLEPGSPAQPPMHAMPVDFFFRLSDTYNVQLTSNFFAFWATEKAGNKGEAAKALEAARRLAALQEARALAGGSLAAGVKLLEAQEAARPAEPCCDAEVRKVFRKFWGNWLRGDRQMDAAATLGRGGVSAAGLPGSGAVRDTGKAMPLRFADASTRRHTTRMQHPVFATTNSVYGQKAAQQTDMPPVYAAATQHFTKSFPVPAPKTTGLVTAVTKSKVHKALDDY